VLPRSPAAHGTADPGPCLSSWPDRAIGLLVIALVILPPLAVGAVYPWAYSTIEIAIFGGLALWMGLIILGREELPVLSRSRMRGITLPSVLLLGLCVVQLLPLPPAKLRVLSPVTYRIYAESLDGWPSQRPYQWLVTLKVQPAVGSVRSAGTILQPIRNEVKAEAPAPFRAQSTAAPHVSSQAAASSAMGRIEVWRSLSLMPRLGWTSLFKLNAYLALLYIVALFPFAAPAHEAWFIRWTNRAVLLSGLAVASIGLLERATWNGKALWIVVPYQWSDAFFGPTIRAHGPFVNPDHFANYLAMILPLAIVVTIWPRTVCEAASVLAFRIFGATVSLIVFAALLMSMSRAALGGTSCGLVILGLVLTRHPRDEAYEKGFVARHTVLVLVGGVALAFLLSVPLTGGSGMNEVGGRLVQAVGTETGRDDRLPVWQDAVAMVADFPLTGIGLSSFSELFPRYQRPPWSPISWDRTHNDYLQSLIELGVPGLLLILWAAVAVLWRIARGLRLVPTQRFVLIGAIVAGAVAAAIHEFFDFPLQIPANALLLVVLVGLALRLVDTRPGEIRVRSRVHNHLLAGGITLGAAGLVIAALAQNQVPFPFDVHRPNTPQEARDLILSDPARSRAHLLLVERFGQSLTPAQTLSELRRTLWLEPTNPFARDRYARGLRNQGQPREALSEMTQSVFMSPMLDTHGYLDSRFIPYLSVAERAAITTGFKEAVDHHFFGAVGSFGYFLQGEGDYAAKAILYAQEAGSEPDQGNRVGLLLQAGEAYALAGKITQAEAAFRKALQDDPANPRPYSDLISMVCKPMRDMVAAKALVAQGVQAGADPFALYLALGQAQEVCLDPDGAAASLRQALKYRPSDFAATVALGGLYQRQGDIYQAIILMRRATQIDPASADAFYYLAVAEDVGYRYFDAEKNYARAVALNPKNAQFREAYEAFKRKVAENGGGQS
jgi:tetratricopeptide (TPR) repeat protein/O-antigen ligase